MNTPQTAAGTLLSPSPCSPWNRGDKPPTLPLTVIGVVGNKPVLVWYHDRTKCWHDNPAAFGSVPVEWWQYLPDSELLKANVRGMASPG